MSCARLSLLLLCQLLALVVIVICCFFFFFHSPLSHMELQTTIHQSVYSFRYLGVHIFQDTLDILVTPIFQSCTIKANSDGKYHHLVLEQHQAGQDSAESRLTEPIICTKPPDLQCIYTKRCWTKFRKIMKDLNHPNNELFSLLMSGKKRCSLKGQHKKNEHRQLWFPTRTIPRS